MSPFSGILITLMTGQYPKTNETKESAFHQDNYGREGSGINKTLPDKQHQKM
eukprot:c32536_g1_i1 orf=132-287(+)